MKQDPQSVDENRRFFSMADVYDQMAPSLVPGYDFLQDELLRFLRVDSWEKPVIVDLGAGSGRLLEKVLEANPTARCCWIDYSEDFLRVAKKRLHRFHDRVDFIIGRMEDDWESSLIGSPDLIISMSAIHHLTSIEKQSLYGKCFKMLSGGGWFANVDEMQTIEPSAYLTSLQLWVDHVSQYRSRVPEADIDAYEEWAAHFENWKKRNVENADKPKKKGDDLHDLFPDQIAWLRTVGFQRADVIIKYYLWCVLVGQKAQE